MLLQAMKSYVVWVNLLRVSSTQPATRSPRRRPKKEVALLQAVITAVADILPVQEVADTAVAVEAAAADKTATGLFVPFVCLEKFLYLFLEFVII